MPVARVSLAGQAKDDSYSSEYGLDGHRIIHNNVILLLYRLLRPSGLESNNMNKPAPGSNIESAKSFNDVPDKSLWTPFDPSGSYILQASVRVQDGSKPEIMTLGINELQAFKDMMKGIIDLEVGDRLAMDTRVK